MTQDFQGLPVSVACAGTLEAFNAYGRDWLSYGPRVRSIFEAAERDPGNCLVNAHAAAVNMALESSAGFRAARPLVVRAKAAARDATGREKAFVAAVYAWWRGDVKGASCRLQSIVRDNPGDMVTAKWAQYHAFNAGDAPAMLDIAQRVVDVRGDTAEAWGMLAFGLEQSNQLPQAEQAARQALELRRGEAWAQHAIAHVMDAQGLVDEGIAFLSSHADTWADRSLFIREHNYWHLALFHLDRDDHAAALGIFDRHLWGEWPEFAQEQIGAISALWRLELRGVDVGDRWRPVVDKIVERWHEHILPFNDLHFVKALSRGGRRAELEAFLASMARHGAQDDSGVWESLAIPVAHAIVAHAEGRFDKAAGLLAPCVGRLHLIGGSHAQRDVFIQTWIDAALRAGHHSSVADTVTRRARARPMVPAERRLVQRLSKAA